MRTLQLLSVTRKFDHLYSDTYLRKLHLILVGPDVGQQERKFSTQKVSLIVKGPLLRKKLEH